MNASVALDLFYLALVSVLVWWYARKWLGRAWRSTLTLENGHAYTYVMGDHMRLYRSRGTFHGIDILLPKELPHIYLDSLKGGGHQVRFVFDSSQRIALEGDFNEYFNVFVPKRYKALALSILSPDVMVALQDYATSFDVEIYADHVRVISNKRVSGNPMLQDFLMAVALRVMKEIDHRLSSWTPEAESEASQQDLHVYPGGGMRIAGRYVTYWTIGWTIYWFVASIGIGIGGAFALTVNTPEYYRMGVSLLAIFVALLMTLVMVTIRRWRSDSFWSKRR